MAEISGAFCGRLESRPAAISCWITAHMPPPIASTTTGGSAASPSGSASGSRNAVKRWIARSARSSAAAPAVGSSKKASRAKVPIGDQVLEQAPHPAFDRRPPVAAGGGTAGGRPQRPPRQLVEGGEEGLLLAVEVLVEGLVGGSGGGRYRRNRQRRVAVSRRHLRGCADDPFALGEGGPAAAAVGGLLPVEIVAGRRRDGRVWGRGGRGEVAGRRSPW